MNEIRQYFEQSIHQKIEDQEWIFFHSMLSRHELSKHQLLLREGQVEEYLWFVERGILRSYIPGGESDITVAFTFEKNFVSGYDSFLTREPSLIQIETLTEASLWRLTYNDLQVIYQETKIGNRIGRHAGEELFLRKSNRERSLLRETAEQRYLRLLTEQPHYLKHIPLKHIASYIGVTPQALSRIRKRIT